MNFEINLISLTKPFFQHYQKVMGKTLISWEWKNLLRWNKKHYPSFLKGFKMIKITQILLRGESPTLKTIVASDAKISVFIISVEAIICLWSYNLYDCSFKQKCFNINCIRKISHQKNLHFKQKRKIEQSKDIFDWKWENDSAEAAETSFCNENVLGTNENFQSYWQNFFTIQKQLSLSYII